MYKVLKSFSLGIAIYLSVIFLFKKNNTLILPNYLKQECIVPTGNSKLILYRDCIKNNPNGCEYEFQQRKQFCPKYIIMS